MKWKWEMEELSFSLLKNASISSDNCLAPNRQQDIIWNRGDLVYLRKYASLSFNESWSYFYCCSEMTMSWFINFWIRKSVKPVIISLENRVAFKRAWIVSYCPMNLAIWVNYNESWSYFYCCSEMTMSWFINFWIRKSVKPVIISLENRVAFKRAWIVSYCPMNLAIWVNYKCVRLIGSFKIFC